MSAATDAVLAKFGSDVNAITNDIAADIDQLIASSGGATVEQLEASFAPITEQLRAVAAKYPATVPTPEVPPVV